MQPELIAIAAGFVAVIAVAFYMARSGRAGEITDRIADLAKAAEIARTLVMAAEQLHKTGQLEDSERFHYVRERLEAYFPDLDDETLKAMIEAAVHWLKVLRGEPDQPAPAANYPYVTEDANDPPFAIDYGQR